MVAIVGFSVERPRFSNRVVVRDKQHCERVKSASSQRQCSNGKIEVNSNGIIKEAFEVIRLGQQLGVNFGNLEEAFLQQIVELEIRDGEGQARGTRALAPLNNGEVVQGLMGLFWAGECGSLMCYDCTKLECERSWEAR